MLALPPRGKLAEPDPTVDPVTGAVEGVVTEIAAEERALKKGFDRKQAGTISNTDRRSRLAIAENRTLTVLPNLF